MKNITDLLNEIESILDDATKFLRSFINNYEEASSKIHNRTDEEFQRRDISSGELNTPLN